jgi:uncharacterized protein with HEPN domain
MKDDRLYLIHIRDCIARIEQYIREGQTQFQNDTKTQDAVLRNLQVLAESTQRLSDGLKARHSEVPWRTIAAFRNVLVHGYLGVNLERVWQILHEDLPPLWDRFLKFSKKVRLDEI